VTTHPFTHPEAEPALRFLQERFPQRATPEEIAASYGDSLREPRHFLAGLQTLQAASLAVKMDDDTWAATEAGMGYSL
jgi:hypothetical protein